MGIRRRVDVESGRDGGPQCTDIGRDGGGEMAADRYRQRERWGTDREREREGGPQCTDIGRDGGGEMAADRYRQRERWSTDRERQREGGPQCTDKVLHWLPISTCTCTFTCLALPGLQESWFPNPSYSISSSGLLGERQW